MFNFVSRNVRCFTGLVAVEALVTELSLELVHLTTESLEKAVLFVEFTFHTTESSLTFTDIRANSLVSHAEITVVLELVVLNQTEVFLSVAKLILDLDDISVRLGLQVVKFGTELRDFDIHWVVYWCADNVFSHHRRSNIHWSTGISHWSTVISHGSTHGRKNGMMNGRAMQSVL